MRTVDTPGPPASLSTAGWLRSPQTIGSFLSPLNRRDGRGRGRARSRGAEDFRARKIGVVGAVLGPRHMKIPDRTPDAGANGTRLNRLPEQLKSSAGASRGGHRARLDRSVPRAADVTRRRAARSASGPELRCKVLGNHAEVWFARDSPLEGAGFELSVPREIGLVSRLCRLSTDLSRRIEGADQ